VIVVSGDGAPSTKLGSHSSWYVVGLVGNAHPRVRAKYPNMLLFALTEGPKEPPCLQGVMRVCVDDWLPWEKGKWIRDYSNSTKGEAFLCRVRFAVMVSDFPGGAKTMNMVPHNSYSMCPFCDIRGVGIRTGGGPKKGHKRVYPTHVNDGVRGRESGVTVSQMNKAERLRKAYIDKGQKSSADYTAHTQSTGTKGYAQLLRLLSFRSGLSWVRPWDLMHGYAGQFERHIIRLLSGEGCSDKRHVVPKHERRGASRRYRHFYGPGVLVRSNADPFDAARFKSHHWVVSNSNA
jgi:hypothetical protein